MIIHSVEQGSLDWYNLRLGIPTASSFHKIITPAKGDLSKQADKYMYLLIAEKLLNRSLESLEGLEWIERGKELEPTAIKAYEFLQEVKTEKAGFITSDDGQMGATPDLLVGTDGLVEIKCPAPQTHVGYFIDGFDADYKPQVQGQLLISEREWCDRYSFHPELPQFCQRTYRDEEYIGKMRVGLQQFNDKRLNAYEKIKSQGFFAERSRILLPQDSAYQDALTQALEE